MGCIPRDGLTLGLTDFGCPDSECVSDEHAPRLGEELQLAFAAMTQLGRRQFLATLGAGIVGMTGALAACSSADGKSASTPPTVGNTDGVLAGLTLEVRRDPG